jgi:hypothetical protein
MTTNGTEPILAPWLSGRPAGSEPAGMSLRDEMPSAGRATEPNQAVKLAELERLLNDPSAPVDPDRVWVLVGELARAHWDDA